MPYSPLRTARGMMAVASTGIPEQEHRDWTLAQTPTADDCTPWEADEDVRRFRAERDSDLARGVPWFRIDPGRRPGSGYRHADRA